MKNYTSIKNLFYLILFLLSTATVAQVGIDNPLPDPNAILDLKASDKGVLIPRMTTVQRFSLLTSCTPSCPSGLLVFDTNRKAFFFLDANQWYAMTPFTTPDASSGSNEDIATDNVLVQDVGIGTTPGAGIKLHVNGTVRVENQLSVQNQVTVQTGNVVVSAGNLDVNTGTIASNGNISSNGVVIADGYGATQFRSDGASNFAGPVPRGLVAMWSGSVGTIPAGWAVCDGSNGTPDLRERFVVGAGGDNPTVGAGLGYSVDARGGENFHALSISEMPSHNHGGSTSTNGNHNHNTLLNNRGFDYDGSDAQGLTPDNSSNSWPSTFAGDHSHSISPQGSDAPHENRPPYYALAYIMKL